MENTSNAIQFKSLISDYLAQNNKYELQLRHFMEFLSDKEMEDRAFNLYPKDIDEFFKESFKDKIGTEAQVNSHMSALGSLFDYLISKEYKFSELSGYIKSPEFRRKMFQQVDKTENKTILSKESLRNILVLIDNYLQDNTSNKKQKYYEILIARIFIKLSLILPLRVSQMLNISIGDIHDNNMRYLVYNDIQIKLPNSLRLMTLRTTR